MMLEKTIAKLFEKRGMGSNDIRHFFSQNLRELPDLTDLFDLKKASARIILALKQNDVIGVYGDYDVDGTTSCALLYYFFKMYGQKVKLFQPDRFQEGYGLHESSIDKAHEENIQLLITVDCGITSWKAAEYAKTRNIDLIITDHHRDIAESMPPAFAVVNPNRRDAPKDSPLGVLAGVGVAFCLALQIKKDLEEQGNKMPSLYELLQFVAIGTICDQVSLTSTNLKLVRHGLKQLPRTQFPGLKVFLSQEDRSRKQTGSEKLAFEIGPLINSKGRLEHPEQSLKTLISDNSQDAYEYYSRLKICNQERKIIQSAVYKEARKQVIKSMSVVNDHEHMISIVYQSDWHEGVIGIVASKLVDNFKVPAIVFTDTKEGLIKGSARSAGELSIFDCLCECQDLFTKFGGHRAAAGLSMPKQNLPLFIDKMNVLLREIPAISRTCLPYYDLEINPGDITPELAQGLEELEPFGQGNPRPIFKMKKFVVKSYKILKDHHVRWNIAADMDGKAFLQGISFNYIDKWGVPHPEEVFKNQKHPDYSPAAYFNLGINRFNGNEFIQLNIDRITLQDL